MSKPILDMCCGSKMFWFDKSDPRVIFCDIRTEDTNLCDGRPFKVQPDMIADFRNLPFNDEQFNLVVFDPPHLHTCGDESWLKMKYGRLDKQTYRQDLKKGFDEAWRVLRKGGSLIFKWNEEQIPLPEILKAIDYKPLLVQKRSKTQFLVFMKEEEQ